MNILKFIKDKYGSKKGLALNVYYSTLQFLGLFKRYKNINLTAIDRVIFVCAGNICRSPLAEAVAHKFDFPTDSYGLNCRGGDGGDPRAIQFCSMADLDLTKHITKNISTYIPQQGDLVIGMEPKHIKHLKPLIKDRAQLTLIGLWLQKPKPYIHDPYNTNAEYFYLCETQVAKATECLLVKLGS